LDAVESEELLSKVNELQRLYQILTVTTFLAVWVSPGRFDLQTHVSCFSNEKDISQEQVFRHLAVPRSSTTPIPNFPTPTYPSCTRPIVRAPSSGRIRWGGCVWQHGRCEQAEGLRESCDVPAWQLGCKRLESNKLLGSAPTLSICRVLPSLRRSMPQPFRACGAACRHWTKRVQLLGCSLGSVGRCSRAAATACAAAAAVQGRRRRQRRRRCAATSARR
jgi:hypothetical protein